MCSTGSSALWKWSDIGKSDVPNVPGYFSAHCRDQAQTLPLPYMCSCWQLWQLANVQSWQTNWLSQLCNPVRMSRHMQTLSVTDMSTQFSPSLSYSLLEWTRQWLEVLRKMLSLALISWISTQHSKTKSFVSLGWHFPYSMNMSKIFKQIL